MGRSRSSFHSLGSCFSKDGGPQEYVKMRLGERLKTFGAMKMMFGVRSGRLGVRRE